MAEVRPMLRSESASQVLGRKLDSIPFSGYHILIIAVLALVGFIEGYDLVMTGSLVVLAKGPLHLTGTDIRILVSFPTFMLVPRRLLLLGDIRPFEPQDHRADRRVPDDISDPADPAGAKCRAADHPAPVDRASAPAAWFRRRSRSPPN